MSWAFHKLKLAADVCRGVAYLHSRSPPVIHRDLKARAAPHCITACCRCCALTPAPADRQRAGDRRVGGARGGHGREPRGGRRDCEGRCTRAESHLLFCG